MEIKEGNVNRQEYFRQYQKNNRKRIKLYKDKWNKENKEKDNLMPRTKEGFCALCLEQNTPDCKGWNDCEYSITFYFYRDKKIKEVKNHV